MRTRAIRAVCGRIARGRRGVLAATLIAFTVAGCGENPVTPPPITFPTTNVSFNGHVKPLFWSNCALSGCHDGPRQENGFVGLESYAQVLSSGVVSPGSAERSRLAQVLRGSMLHPNDDYFLAITTAQREGIIQWIREGALDN